MVIFVLIQNCHKLYFWHIFSALNYEFQFQYDEQNENRYRLQWNITSTALQERYNTELQLNFIHLIKWY